jgi:hypothetical protein
MQNDADALDKSDEHEFNEDLITLLYLLILLIYVLFGQSAYVCLYVIVVLNVASILCSF